MKKYIPLFEEFDNKDLFPVHADIAKRILKDIKKMSEDEQDKLTKEDIEKLIKKRFPAEPGTDNIKKVVAELKKIS